MILVDSSIWIDFFRDEPTAQTEWLDRNIATEGELLGNLILAEVLRVSNEDRVFEEARRMHGLDLNKWCVAAKTWRWTRRATSASSGPRA